MSRPPYFIERSGGGKSSGAPGQGGNPAEDCVLCGKRVAGDGWVQFVSGLYAHGDCTLGLQNAAPAADPPPPLLELDAHEFGPLLPPAGKLWMVRMGGNQPHFWAPRIELRSPLVLFPVVIRQVNPHDHGAPLRWELGEPVLTRQTFTAWPMPAPADVMGLWPG